MSNDYLLSSSLAKSFYQEIKSLPIVDYHNHLSVEDIKSNKRYLDIYDLWIKPDPYKHRAMRMMGVKEELITGNASSKDKFIAWCSIYPNLVNNPLYIWSQVELETVFNIKLAINQKNAIKIYTLANAYLKKHVVTPKYLLKLFKVEKACPCMSLTDDITYFKRNDVITPSLRGDNILLPTKAFINSLMKLTKVKINNLDTYLNALKIRIKAFRDAGCVFSDHALDNNFLYLADDKKNNNRFLNLIKDKSLSNLDKTYLSSYILFSLMGIYKDNDMVVQLHIGAERFTSSRLRELAGAAGGFATIGNSVNVKSLTTFFDEVEKRFKHLPKIVLFTLNPSDNELLATLSGSYACDNVSGLITLGPAWWWCDHKYQIEKVLDAISNFSLLVNFIGMTTDSRSFLSLVRHDYFRRVLSSYLANKINNKELPYNKEDLSNLIKKVSYLNANKLFKENHHVIKK